jgi:hypothetical protein
MRGFLVNAEIFLYTSGEEILFDREMGQLDFTCICCSKAECKIKPIVFTF